VSRELWVICPSWNGDRAETLISTLDTLADGNVTYIVVGASRPENAQPRRAWWLRFQLPMSPVEAMAAGAQLAIEHLDVEDDALFAFLHDDMTIDQQGWDLELISHFEKHPRCGLAGLGGALGFATDDIYRSPYDYRQLERIDFVSNMREAEAHGRRVTEPQRVAALDGFSLIVTREFYQAVNVRDLHSGFPPQNTGYGQWNECLRDGIPFHMYDAWISCRAAELGYETWLIPLACHHEGGRTSVGMAEQYRGVVERLGYESPEDLYAKAHQRIYERFQRVLPIRVPHNCTTREK
jgi:hypothetical protein